MKVYEFDAEIKKHDSMDAAFIEFPYDVEKEFGIKGQVKIKATFDGFEYRGSLAKMGHHCHILGITKKIRNEISKQPGELVHVTLALDDEERIVELPEDFKNNLKENDRAKVFYNNLSYSHQKKYVDWILSAKKLETREKRIKEAVEMLSDGVRTVK